MASLGIPSATATTAGMTPELLAYYSDRKLTWRNISFISLCNLGWSIGPAVFMPLMTLALYDMGMTEARTGTMAMLNSWLVAYLVMYFSWSSDHMVSTIGRRKIYLIIAAPFIIVPSIIFPWMIEYGLFTCIVLMAVQMLFGDLKASTFPLLNIDCMPREFLARAGAILGIVAGIFGFVINRWGVQSLSEWHYWAPYAVGGLVMAITTALAMLIREPPIYNPTREPFKPWSALKIGLKQKRNIVLFLGASSVHTFAIVWGTWSFLYATRSLNLDWKEVLAATSWSSLVALVIAFPIAWLVDRFVGIKLIFVFWALQVVAFCVAWNSGTVTDMLWMAILLAIIWPLYSSADILVYRSAPPEAVGSVTSSCSLFRNLYAGCVSGITGWIISLSGQNYAPAFLFGIIMSTIGLLLYVIYWAMVRRDVQNRADAPSGSIL